MASRSLANWQGQRSRDLDEILQAHAAIGGTGRGRRYATQQVNQAYAVLLSSQFQGFCRDLHSESVDHIASAVQPVALQSVLQVSLEFARKLDRGNPNSGNIGNDFNRLGLLFWPKVLALEAKRNQDRRAKLDKLIDWRNAIAHHNFGPDKQKGLQLAVIQDWRKACDGLALSFDKIMASHIKALVGHAPW